MVSTTPDFAIVGTGAVGGYYGGLLQQAGFGVHFLLHSDYEHVRHHGLKIESPGNNFSLPKVNAYSHPEQMPRCDVVIVSLKTIANSLLPDILPHLVRSDSIVITLQNGLGSEETMARLVGADAVMGGLCFLCSNKVGPGHIRHLDYGLVTLGEFRTDGQAGGITPRLKEMGQKLAAARIPLRLVDDLQLARWKKLVWNIPFNGLSVVRNALTDALVSHPETKALCQTLMDETAAAAAVCARPITPDFIKKMMTDTLQMKPYATSMKLDFDRGKPMEIESIYGNPLRAAQRAGVAMLETERLYRQLLAINTAL